MVTKKNLNKLTGSGKLTGKEVGLLSIQCMEDIDNNKEPVYNKEELARMRDKLSPLEEHKFKMWLDLHQYIKYLVKEAEIKTLRAKSSLKSTISLLKDYLNNWRVESEKRDVPVIMTEKEYKDKKELYKKRNFNIHRCIKEVIAWRASKIAEEEEEEFKESHYQEFIAEEHPEYFQRAEEEIKELIDKNKLNPVKLDVKAYYKKVGDKENISSWPKHDDIKASSDKAIWLYQNYISGEELYKAELPEWKDWIDDYKLGYFNFQENERGWSDLKQEIAIVDNPNPSNVDEKGWYKKDDLFNDILGIERAHERLYEVSREEDKTIQEFFDKKILGVKKFISIFKTFQKTINKFDEIAGTELITEVTYFEYEVKDTIGDFNDIIDWSFYFKDEKVEIEPIKFEEIELEQDWIEEERNIISNILGPKWWEKDPEEVDIYVK